MVLNYKKESFQNLKCYPHEKKGWVADKVLAMLKGGGAHKVLG